MIAALFVQDVLKGSSLVRGLVIIVHVLLAAFSALGLAAGGIGIIGSLVTLAYSIAVIVVLVRKSSELVKRKSREIDSRMPLAVLGITVVGTIIGSVLASAA